MAQIQDLWQGHGLTVKDRTRSHWPYITCDRLNGLRAEDIHHVYAHYEHGTRIPVYVGSDQPQNNASLPSLRGR